MSRIHSTALIDASAVIGEDVEIGPFCMVGAGSRIGDGTQLVSHVVIHAGVTIGAHNEIHSGAVLGGAPQDKSYQGEPTTLAVGDDNVIRECVTMNRGTVKAHGTTVVGSRNLIMACCHVGHDCRIGNDIVMSNNVLLAGHVQVADRVVFGGSAAVHHFTRIGTMAFVGGLSAVEYDVPPFVISNGRPSRARTLNHVGLKRAEISDPEVQHLRHLFSRLFRSDTPLIRFLDEDAPQGGELAQQLFQFMRERSSAPTGRYLERFRNDRKGG
jgi:UDP-N-acetylglucosamine acyltransferase